MYKLVCYRKKMNFTDNKTVYYDAQTAIFHFYPGQTLFLQGLEHNILHV